MGRACSSSTSPPASTPSRHSLVRLDLSKAGATVVTTTQPSSTIFFTFDRLVVLGAASCATSARSRRHSRCSSLRARGSCPGTQPGRLHDGDPLRIRQQARLHKRLKDEPVDRASTAAMPELLSDGPRARVELERAAEDATGAQRAYDASPRSLAPASAAAADRLPDGRALLANGQGALQHPREDRAAAVQHDFRLSAAAHDHGARRSPS